MPTFAIARWATSRVTGLTVGNAVRNRFRKNTLVESKLQGFALDAAGLVLAILVATIVASAVESAIDIAADSLSNN